MNEVSKEERGKCGNTTKANSDIVRSKSDDVQNSELAGGFEIFVDGLPKDCAEEDIAMVFSQYGEVKSVRIIKNSSTEKSKDIAFVCYASIEAAKKALIEFKEGLEVLNLTMNPSTLLHSYSNKSKLNAFCSYAVFLCCLHQVKGEKVRVSACQDNNTLYLGNICKGWTKDQA
jgi:RNA recognition motif-containing protein